MGEVTQLIAEAREGDRAALGRLFELLYPELRQAAHRRLARGPREGGVDTTALVNECYLKLAQREQLRAGDRAHFLAYAAATMRSIIVDAARQAGTARHGGDAEHLPLSTDVNPPAPQAAREILELDEALRELARVDPRLASVVEMRYFGGLEDAEIAEALGLSRRTVSRDWEKARLLLAHALSL